MTAPPDLDRRAGLPEPASLRLGPWRVLASVRGAVVTATLLGCAVLIVFATLGSGPLPVSPVEVIDTLLRRTDEFDFVVLDIGLPRACVALLVGAGLGAAGALLQALTRNPLGSPDVIGFDSGAAAGALVALLVIGVGERVETAVFAIAGGAVAALLVFLLSSGTRDTGYRIILIGIGLGALLDSVSAYLLTRSSVRESMNATRWLVGSLNSSEWGDVAVAGLGLLVLLPAAAALGRQLRVVLLGPEAASALGVRLGPVTGATLAVSVGLSAVAVLAAGPISFVALAAPQLAGRLVGLRRVPAVLASAAMGATLLAAADLIGSRAFGETDLPVGVVTGGVGGVYLAWLLRGNGEGGRDGWRDVPFGRRTAGAALRRPGGGGRSRPGRPGRPVQRDRRAERLRQVHPAAGAGPDPAAARRPGAAGRPRHPRHAGEGGGADVGMLPQSAVAPETITVLDLVGRGRFPHQSLLRQWSDADQAAVEQAMAAAGVTELAERPVDELSGGQRQRAWLAMVLAQQTELLLLDEPTTFLDITHQLDVLDLCADLRDDGYTVVAVLHDLNHACRYADHLIAMVDGRIVASGAPEDVVTPELVAEVFGLTCTVIPDPATGTPMVVPAARSRRAAR